MITRGRREKAFGKRERKIIKGGEVRKSASEGREIERRRMSLGEEKGK
jgi:hypothetical protein